MLVNRFQTAIPAATLIVGFTFTGLVETNLIATVDIVEPNVRHFSKVFVIFSAMALACGTYALAVSALAILLGQQLAIQASADITKQHEANVQELSKKFLTVLAALAISLVSVIGASICAIWVRTDLVYSSIATGVVLLLLPAIVWGCWTMLARLQGTLYHSNGEQSTLHLHSEKGTLKVSEFRVGDRQSMPPLVKSDVEAVMGLTGSKPTEASKLLNCLPPCAA